MFILSWPSPNYNEVIIMSEDKRVVTTKFVLDNPTIRGGQLFGVKAILYFTVSMNAEDKQAGEFIQVENLTVDFNGSTFQNVLADAMANRKVKWQSPMRNNIDKIASLSNTTVNFEDVLYTSRAKTVPVTEASATEFFNNLTPEQQAAFLASLQASTNPASEA